MGRLGKRVTTSLDLRTKRSNNKQKSGFSITDITNKDFRKLLNKFKNSPYLGYKNKQDYNEPTKAYILITKQITKLMKTERQFRTNFLKSGVNKRIGHVNKAIQYNELESNRKTATLADKDRQTSSAYDIKD